MTTAIHCREQLEAALGANRQGLPGGVYLKMNTGMNRLGFTARDFSSVLGRLLRQVPGLDITLMNHFAEADGERGIAEQFSRFKSMAGDWSGPVSLANSAAVLRHPATHGDWVRPGIMLYGASPFADQTAAGLEPVMSLESKIIAIQEVPAGERVGYGGTFTAPGPTRIGIAACGYADGYPRSAPNGTPPGRPWPAYRPGRARLHGHAGLRPEPHPRGPHRFPRDPVGVGPGRRG